MLLQLADLARRRDLPRRARRGIIVPIGSTEQHGPNGLLGTDAICPEVIAKGVGDASDMLVGPTFNVGQAQHHLGFAGTISLRPTTLIAAIYDWTASLVRHGFERVYWFNGHGGNIATVTAAFSEIYAETEPEAGRQPLSDQCSLRNWWECGSVKSLPRELSRDFGEGSHATPSEVSVTCMPIPTRRIQMTIDDAEVAPRGRSSTPTITAAAFPTAASAPTPACRVPRPGKRLFDAAGEGPRRRLQGLGRPGVKQSGAGRVP